MDYYFLKIMEFLFLGIGGAGIWIYHKIRKTPIVEIKMKASTETQRIKNAKMEKKIDIACTLVLIVLWIFVCIPCVLDLPYLFMNNLQEVSGFVKSRDMQDAEKTEERSISVQDEISGERVLIKYQGMGIDKNQWVDARVLPHTSYGEIIKAGDAIGVAVQEIAETEKEAKREQTIWKDIVKNSIYLVFVIPIIQAALGGFKENKKRERFKGTIYLSRRYGMVFGICNIILVIMSGALCLIFGIKETWSICALFAGLIVIIEAVNWSFTRYKIVVGENSLKITPFIGLKRETAYQDIERIEITAIGDLKVFAKGKKVCLVDSDAIGYKEFYKMMQEKGYIETETTKKKQ